MFVLWIFSNTWGCLGYFCIGSSTFEHADLGRCGGYPVAAAELNVKLGSGAEHVNHVCHITNVPGRHVDVKTAGGGEHLLHVRHF